MQRVLWEQGGALDLSDEYLEHFERQLLPDVKLAHVLCIGKVPSLEAFERLLTFEECNSGFALAFMCRFLGCQGAFINMLHDPKRAHIPVPTSSTAWRCSARSCPSSAPSPPPPSWSFVQRPTLALPSRQTLSTAATASSI